MDNSQAHFIVGQHQQDFDGCTHYLVFDAGKGIVQITEENGLFGRLLLVDNWLTLLCELLSQTDYTVTRCGGCTTFEFPLHKISCIVSEHSLVISFNRTDRPQKLFMCISGFPGSSSSLDLSNNNALRL